MKVTRKNDNEKSVKELLDGECFLWNNKLFIATDEFDAKGYRRCVRLKTGNIFYFENGEGDGEYVTPVDAEVVFHD